MNEDLPQSGSQKLSLPVATSAAVRGEPSPASAAPRPWRFVEPSRLRDPYFRVLDARGDEVMAWADYSPLAKQYRANFKLIVAAVNLVFASDAEGIEGETRWAAVGDDSKGQMAKAQTSGDISAVLEFAERNGLDLSKGARS